MKRVFFDWDRPFLPGVAKYIVETGIAKASRPRELDLSKYVYILSGQRAIRTLESYVQLEAQKAIDEDRIEPDWNPPAYLKLGAAPESLYSPTSKLAGKLVRLYSMRKAAMKYLAGKSEEAQILLPDPPKTFAAQLELASTFLKLKEELDSERKTYADIEEYCAQYEPTTPDNEVIPQNDDAKRWRYDEAKRWRALAEIDKYYSVELKIHEMTDLNNARIAALKTIGDPAYDAIDGVAREYRVIGAVDLNKLQKSVFERLGDRVEFWVFAPESESAAFDEFGCVLPEAWEKRPIPLQNEQLFQVDKPVDQGEAANLLVRELSKRYDADGNWTYEPLDPYSLTIGAPDDEVTPFVESRLQDLGYETVVGEGAPMKQNRAYQLLENLADYLETRSFSAFEELLRRYDLSVFFRNNWDAAYPEGLTKAEEEEETQFAEATSTDGDDIGAEDYDTEDVSQPTQDEIEEREAKNFDWLRDLDNYRARYMPMRVDGLWFKHDDQDNNKRSLRFVSLRKASNLLNHALLAECGFWSHGSGAEALVRSNVVVTEDSGDIEALKIARYTAEDNPFTGKLAALDGMFDEKKRWSANQLRRSLNAWAKPLSQLMCAIYGSARFADAETQAQIDGFFKAFNKALGELNDVPAGLAADMTGSDAIRVVLKQISDSRTDPAPKDDPIELQGWLDLLFDDAPDLILTGFNEGTIPSNRSSDLFLPNETRSKIGLSDSKRAFARDAYLTTALIHSRRNLFVVFEKRSLESNPKIPSRFLFATDKTRIPERVVKFCDEDCSDTLKTLRARQLNAAGETTPFPKKRQEIDIEEDENSIPNSLADDPELVALAEKAQKLREKTQQDLSKGFAAPALDLRARIQRQQETSQKPFDVSQMNVTDFEKFLESPYRFFLRKVFGLNPAGDPDAMELNAANFGNIVHDVLRAFGTSEVKDCSEPHVIGNWLASELRRQARSFQNDHTSPFMQIQLEQIESRLRAFAFWQAKWRADGNKIVWVEKGPANGRIEFEAFGTKIGVVGRIDRIDCSEDGKHWYVFDYKTFNSYKSASSSKNPDRSSRPELLTICLNNTVDKKHRSKAESNFATPIRFLRKNGLNVGETELEAEQYRWTNLQLPLYRRIFAQLLAEHKDLSVETVQGQIERQELQIDFAYIVLPKAQDVIALGAPWSKQDFEAAEATAAWVVKTIERLCQGVVKPTDFIDKEHKEFGRMLDNSNLRYGDDFAPITLSYTFEK